MIKSNKEILKFYPRLFFRYAFFFSPILGFHFIDRWIKKGQLINYLLDSHDSNKIKKKPIDKSCKGKKAKGCRSKRMTCWPLTNYSSRNTKNTKKKD